MRSWFPIGLMALLVAGVAALLTVAVRGEIHDRGQQRGTVTVTGCTLQAYGRHGDTYLCDGRFAGPGFEIASVSFDNFGALRAGDLVAASVEGPEDGTAELADEGFWRLLITLTGAAALLGGLVGVWQQWRTGRSGSLAP